MMHDDDVLGKAYDGRLMRRLLALPAAVPAAGGACSRRDHRSLRARAGAAVPDEARRSIATFRSRDLAGLGSIAAIYLVALIASFVLEYLQTWTMQVDRAADHVRPADAARVGTCSGSTCASTIAIRSAG